MLGASQPENLQALTTEHRQGDLLLGLGRELSDSRRLSTVGRPRSGPWFPHSLGMALGASAALGPFSLPKVVVSLLNRVQLLQSHGL